MRFITYQSQDGPSLGVLANGTIDAFVPLSGTLLEILNRGEAGLFLAQKALDSGTPQPLAGIQLLAPIPEPRRNVFCLGWNYAEHSKESAAMRGKPAKLPDRPIFFTKLTTAVNAHEGTIAVDTRISEQYDWEVELGLVIGQAGKDIPRDRALDHVFGYTVINDVSVRDVQVGHGGQFFKGKSLDGTCPMGPWIITRDEIPDPHRLDLRCSVNGVLKQEGNTADFIFDIPAIIEWLSQGLTLLPGDIIATGTPAGVGFARNPPEFLQPGDVVECEVEGVGLLRNHVVRGA
jgi:2-keto-4-pentenoate hydratase/2-oxohepta-3-ene-1,7-dioic acid hydratase in catechol pathway